MHKHCSTTRDLVFHVFSIYQKLLVFKKPELFDAGLKVLNHGSRDHIMNKNKLPLWCNKVSPIQEEFLHNSGNKEFSKAFTYVSLSWNQSNTSEEPGSFYKQRIDVCKAWRFITRYKGKVIQIPQVGKLLNSQIFLLGCRMIFPQKLCS